MTPKIDTMSDACAGDTVLGASLPLPRGGVAHRRGGRQRASRGGSRPPSRCTATARAGPSLPHGPRTALPGGAERLPPAPALQGPARLAPPQPGLFALWAPRRRGAALGSASAALRCYFDEMHAHKIRVENGRIKLDEPTNLPDGAEVELVILGGDQLDDEERARLHEALDEAEADIDAGRVVSEEEVWAALRAIK
jgi:hypothetical protein